MQFGELRRARPKFYGNCNRNFAVGIGLCSIAFLKWKVAAGSFRGWGSFDSQPSIPAGGQCFVNAILPMSSHYLQPAKTSSIHPYRGSGPGYGAHAYGKLPIQSYCTLITHTSTCEMRSPLPQCINQAGRSWRMR